MPNILTNLRISEVSSVNRGAGEGVKIMLMKSEDTTMSKIGSMFSKMFGGKTNNETAIDKSVEGLAESVGSIIAEAKDPEELSKALASTFDQFGAHLKKTGITGEVIEKQEGSEMDLKVLAKSLGLPETATEAEVTAKIAKNNEDMATLAKAVGALSLESAIAKANFSEDELAYYNKADGEDDGTDKDADKSIKKSFRLASKAKRADVIKAAAPPVSAEVQKVMNENAALKERLEKLEKKDEDAKYLAKAEEMGLQPEDAETIRKAYSGDEAAIDKFAELVIAAKAAAEEAGLFREFGKKNGKSIGGTAMEQLTQKAEELRKADPKLSMDKAFAKVYEDPANAELVAKERTENRPSAA